MELNSTFSNLANCNAITPKTKLSLDDHFSFMCQRIYSTALILWPYHIGLLECCWKMAIPFSCRDDEHKQ